MLAACPTTISLPADSVPDGCCVAQFMVEIGIPSLPPAEAEPSPLTTPSELRPNQLNQRADDAPQLLAQRGVGGADVAERFRDLEARERFARGAERGVVARISVLAAAVHALRDVERHRRAAAP